MRKRRVAMRNNKKSSRAALMLSCFALGAATMGLLVTLLSVL